jgi:hypothetical protein
MSDKSHTTDQNRGLDLLFIKASINKIGIFGEKIAADIIKILSTHAIHEEAVSWLNGEIPGQQRMVEMTRLKYTCAVVVSLETTITTCNSIINGLE